ncbi:hypothetical protein [Streptomyces wuyuanensis]|uniref:hypothetical protein n=1 Tax=Streptomyces wuyuanensis TaxID=1196353 RepID=UPI003D72A1CA
MGEESDPHVREVANRVSSRRPLVILDAAGIQRIPFAVTAARLAVETVNGHGIAHLQDTHRGWIRRPAPADWNAGLKLGGKQAAVQGAWRALLVALLHNPACRWLTPLDALLAAENKIVQCRAAVRAGIEVPPITVTNDASEVSALPGQLVAKPLGPPQYWLDNGDPRIVFAAPVDAHDPSVAGLLAGAPFILQERVTAIRHLRVVTVGDEAWAFHIPAEGLPLDLRRSAAAHTSWQPLKAPDVEQKAVGLSAAMSIRYSSQDWIETANGVCFIDVNPGGQWLFLPDPEASQISAALAHWLQG